MTVRIQYLSALTFFFCIIQFVRFVIRLHKPLWVSLVKFIAPHISWNTVISFWFGVQFVLCELLFQRNRLKLFEWLGFPNEYVSYRNDPYFISTTSGKRRRILGSLPQATIVSERLTGQMIWIRNNKLNIYHGFDSRLNNKEE